MIFYCRLRRLLIAAGRDGPGTFLLLVRPNEVTSTLGV